MLCSVFDGCYCLSHSGVKETVLVACPVVCSCSVDSDLKIVKCVQSMQMYSQSIFSLMVITLHVHTLLAIACDDPSAVRTLFQ
jgi:hypothetical protein